VPFKCVAASIPATTEPLPRSSSSSSRHRKGMVATAHVRYIVLPRVHATTKSARKNQKKIARSGSSASICSTNNRQYLNTSTASSAASAGSSVASSLWSLCDERSFDAFSVRSDWSGSN